MPVTAPAAASARGASSAANQAALAQRAVQVGPASWLRRARGEPRRPSARARGGRRRRRRAARPAGGSCDTTKPSPDTRAVRPSLTSVRTASRALMPAQVGHRARRAVGHEADDRLGRRPAPTAATSAGSSCRATSTGGAGLIVGATPEVAQRRLGDPLEDRRRHRAAVVAVRPVRRVDHDDDRRRAGSRDGTKPTNDAL